VPWDPNTILEKEGLNQQPVVAQQMVFHYFMGLAYQGQDIVFRLIIIEYSNLRDFKILTLKVSYFWKRFNPRLILFPKSINPRISSH